MSSRLRLFLSSFALFSLSFILSVSGASAANIQVSPGDNLQVALDSAVDGDTIQVAEGTYTGQGFWLSESITVEGGWSSDFTERDIANHPTVIQITGGWGIYGHVMSQGWALDGLTIIGSGTGIGIENCCDDLVVRNCTIKNFDVGIYFCCGENLNVAENCVLEGNGTGILRCDPPVAIYNCLIINNGIGVDSHSDVSGEMVNCTIVGNTTAFNNNWGYNSNVTNSIIWNNGSLDISADVIRYSNVQDPSFAGVNGNISADPLLNADNTLGSGSPCIDAGMETVLQYGEPDNFNAVPLAYNGAAPDMGAYETENVIAASVNISAVTINVRSKGQYLTCFVELPAGSSGDIDAGTVTLEGTVAASSSVELGDSNGNGIADLLVKFDRSSVHALLTQDGETELTVSGSLTDGSAFEGSDTVNVISTGVDHTDEVNPGSVAH